MILNGEPGTKEIIAAILGFGGISGTAVGIAKILFVLFLRLFVILGHAQSGAQDLRLETTRRMF